jgi:hypothetical protein
MQPSVAEYWHMGAMTIRFASSSFPSLMGVKSAGFAKIASLKCSTNLGIDARHAGI